MITRSLFAALIGLFLMFTPMWIDDLSENQSAIATSLIIGFVQFSSSLLAMGKSGWDSWLNWLSLLSGVSFVLFPAFYGLELGETIFYFSLALSTVLLNFYNMDAGNK